MNELEEWQGKSPAENNEKENREGFQTMNHKNTGYGTNPSQPRQRRPRFNNSDRGNYRGGAEQGFRPEGFGRVSSDDYSSYGGRHAQYNNNRGGFDDYDGGQRGGGYGQQRGGGYGQQRGGGYGQQRNGGYGQQQRGGYGQQRGGGYGQQQRGGYNNRPQRGNYNPNAKYSMKKQIEYKEYLADPDAPLRLNKYLANAGICSRREADQFIQAGVVKVNGEVVTELGTKVKRTDTIHFHDQLVSLEKKVYVLLNKPKDYVTTSDDPQARKTVMDLVKNCCRERIYPVGRLDRNTTGVLLFTNDGDLASKLTHPKFLKQKIYHVFLDKNASAADLQKIADGVMLEDGEVHADAISFASETDKKQVGIEIHSGKNRIVRRIFEALGYRVLKLDRVMFAGLTKKGLKRGDWRFLTEQEVAMLHMAQ